jgi:hypothetical protein
VTKDRLSETKKDLQVIAKKNFARIVEMAENFGIGDPDDYSRNGLIDELALRMDAQAQKRQASADEEEEEEEQPKAKKAEPKKPKAKKAEPKPKPEPKPEPKKAKGKPQPKEEPEAEFVPDEEGSRFTTHYNGTEFTEERPGVCAYILEMLYEASRAVPVTKKEMVRRILKKFPGRDEGKTKNLVGMVPTMFRIEKGLHCSSRPTEAGKGYWLEPTETAEVGKARVKAIKEAKKKDE